MNFYFLCKNHKFTNSSVEIHKLLNAFYNSYACCFRTFCFDLENEAGRDFICFRFVCIRNLQKLMLIMISVYLLPDALF